MTDTECICASGFGMNLSCPAHGVGVRSGAAVPSVVPPPEWENPRHEYFRGLTDWYIWARCSCNVRIRAGEKPKGRHCELHSFADLVSGESLLRGALAQQEEKHGST